LKEAASFCNSSLIFMCVLYVDFDRRASTRAGSVSWILARLIGALSDVSSLALQKSNGTAEQPKTSSTATPSDPALTGALSTGQRRTIRAWDKFRAREQRSRRKKIAGEPVRGS
jgi:hypothetical protein